MSLTKALATMDFKLVGWDTDTKNYETKDV